MAIVIKCPACQTPLRVREEYAGKKMKCPKCQGPVPVPGTAAGEHVQTPRPAARVKTEEEEPVVLEPSETVDCPECGKANRATARVCRFCRAPLEEEDEQEEERLRRRSKFKPCPNCGAYGAKRVVWTPWGSFYGPALFTHVRCPECGQGYNGKTGGSNLIPAIIFVTVPLLGILFIVGALAWFLISTYSKH
jgi:predicted RNA-binding Zn-ribbon protein involved in translation (DUF1610 family)